MGKKLIINADDFGLCTGVNRGISEAHSKGVLTSTTIMVNMPGAEEAVKTAKKLPSLGVGVHLNLTEGSPVSKEDVVQCLLDKEGQFTYLPSKLSFLALLKRDFRTAIRTELAAQIQWVIDNGLKPTHLDSHKHIHCSPAIYPMICDLAKDFNISAIRFCLEPKEVWRLPWPLLSKEGKKRAKVTRIMAKINRMHNSQFFKTEALLGVSHAGKINVNFFRAVALYNPAAVAEVMTHPGYTDGLEQFQTRLVKQREVELQALCSEKTKQYMKDAKIELVHYGQLESD